MVPILSSNMEKRLRTGKSKLDKFSHPLLPARRQEEQSWRPGGVCPHASPSISPPPSQKGEHHPQDGWDGMSRFGSLCWRRGAAGGGEHSALPLAARQPRVAAIRLCLGSPGRPGAGNRRRAGGPSAGIMGPDNRATDVTLPAICSPRQPCPPPPSRGAGSQGQSRAGGC